MLVIIGLLLGGVLKGQELINSAKVKNLATDFKNISVYMYGYQDKFRALPGDDIGATSHVGAATIATGSNAGNGLIDGTGTANLGWDGGTTAAPATGAETQLFWLDVRLANLAQGTTAPSTDLLPQNAMGGVVGIISANSANNPEPTGTYQTAIAGTYIVCSSNILGKYATQLDIQMDDGVYNTGSLRVYSQPGGRGTVLTPATTISAGTIDPAGVYVVCMGM